MCQRWKPFYDSSHCNVELVLKANNIEVNNQHAAASFIIKDVQKEFEDFWSNYKQDPLAGKLKKCYTTSSITMSDITTNNITTTFRDDSNLTT